MAKKKEKEYVLPIQHNAVFVFRSNFNVLWNTEINKMKGLTYMRGFPGTMYFTKRRILIVAFFEEKMGWLQRKKIIKFGFEGAIDKIKDWTLSKDQKGHLVGSISFHPHGMLGETTIQFIRLEVKIANQIREFFQKDETIRKPLEDSGIVYFGEDGEDVIRWANERMEKK